MKKKKLNALLDVTLEQNKHQAAMLADREWRHQRLEVAVRRLAGNDSQMPPFCWCQKTDKDKGMPGHSEACNEVYLALYDAERGA